MFYLVCMPHERKSRSCSFYEILIFPSRSCSKKVVPDNHHQASEREPFRVPCSNKLIGSGVAGFDLSRHDNVTATIGGRSHPEGTSN